MENDLERAALSLRPELALTLDRLREAGALGARITGSGPTTFGVFDSRDRAEAVAGLFPGALVATLRHGRN
jgi:4-diphosphocytidyl-2-C-methyl-D-erythritol kinase